MQPEDPYLSKKGMAHSGPVAARLGLSGISYIAETIRLHTIFELIRVTGARIHLGRLSSAEGIELVRQAKKDGLPVTCDVGIHHIHLTEDDIDFFDTNARMTPPPVSYTHLDVYKRQPDDLRLRILRKVPSGSNSTS